MRTAYSTAAAGGHRHIAQTAWRQRTRALMLSSFQAAAGATHHTTWQTPPVSVTTPTEGAITVAKDTEKLIRQLSLISYLMAERRPVTATDIRRDVEGYSKMNEDAFARRYYADRMELAGLGVAITVEHVADGEREQENYSLRRETFHLPAIAFTDAELGGLHTALSLLDGRFAYAEPLRLALQQLTFGRENPLSAPDRRTVGLAVTASAGGQDAKQRLAKIETALERRKTVTFEYHSMSSDEQGECAVDPYHLLFRGEFYLLGYCHRAKRSASSGCRGSAARSATPARASTTSRGRSPALTRATTPTGPTGSSASPSAKRRS